MSKETKALIIEEYKEWFDGVPGTVLVDYTGLDAETAHEFRRGLTEEDLDAAVVKNSLFVKALSLNMELTGPTMAIYGEDPVAAAKLAVKWAKKHKKKLKVKGGTLGTEPLEVKKVKALADLPSREVLLAQVVGGIAAPISGFVNVLAGTIRQVLYALKAIKEEKEGASND